MPDALLQLWPQALLIGVVLAFCAYLAVVLRGQDDLERPGRELAEEMKRQREREAKRKSRRSKSRSPRRVTTARARKAPPKFRPPPGAVASGSTSGDDEASGLFRVLRDGPDFHRPAAAKALSVPFAGTRNAKVVAALADTLTDPEVGVAGRAESYCALRIVMGEDLPWDEEVSVRHAFPKGVDLDWVEAARTAVEDEPDPI